MTIGLDEIISHQGELRVHCTRFLRSAFDADDAVQETVLRAWRSAAGFEGRASVRTWLFRIATNVCLDMLKASRHDVLASDLGEGPGGELDPARVAESGDDLRRALGAALEDLPPFQRTVLVLREGLRWRAQEVAEALGTTTAAVNSALQRARGTMAARHADGAPPARVRTEHRRVVAHCAEAVRGHDVPSLIDLLGSAPHPRSVLTRRRQRT